MINDRHMAVGDWSITLQDDTPQWIRDEFRNVSGDSDFWTSFVCFYENDVVGLDGPHGDSAKYDLANAAVWTGPVWRRGNKMRTFGGPSLVGYLGNAAGSPGGTFSAVPAMPATISQIISAWSTYGLNGVVMGGAASPILTPVDDLTLNSYLPPVKGPLDTLMAQTGNEYWVRPTGELDWGTATNLFRSPPEVIIAEGITAETLGYRTLNVPEDGISYEEDISGLRNASKVVSQDYDLATNIGTASAAGGGSGGPTVYGWDGGACGFYGQTIRADSNDASDVNAIQVAAAGLYNYINREINVTVNDGCVLGQVRPGDWVYIWSPADGIVDTNNQIELAGTIIHPEEHRVVAVRQPFTEGMGAYVVRLTDTVPNEWTFTRITDYVVRDGNSTRLEIGSPPRPSVPPRYQSVLR